MKKTIILISTFMLIFGLTACNQGNQDQVDTWDSSKNIIIYTRDTSSGTRAGFMDGIGFEEAIEQDDVLASGFVTKDNTGIFTSMTTDQYGIGYISLATLDDTVKGLQFNGVSPTVANVINNTYELKRPFNYVTRAWDDYATDEEKQIVEAFVAFLGTTDAADIITNKGAIPLPSTESWDDIKADYQVCTADNSGITIKFGGSDSIEKVAKAITDSFAPKCGNFAPEHDHTGSSDGFKRTQGAEKDGDNWKHVGFASRPFKEDGSETGAADTQGQLAWDAIVAIVHLENELNNVTAEDLKKIYSGEYTVWSDLVN